MGLWSSHLLDDENEFAGNCELSSDFQTRDILMQNKINTLEAERLKWHDLRKDPNDLPTTEDLHNFSKYVLCALKFNDYVFYQVMSIHYPSKTWIVVDSDKNYSDKNVIAWCELPKFKD